MRRLDSLLLAGVGVLAIHQVAYTLAGLAGVTTVVEHGHLNTAWMLGSLAAIAGLGSAVTSSLRRRHHAPFSIGRLSATLAGGYVTLELAERALDGLGAATLFGEAVFWIGLAAVVPIAHLLRLSVRAVADLVLQIVATVVDRPAHPATPAPALFGRTRRTPIPLPVRSRPASRRGAPVRSVNPSDRTTERTKGTTMKWTNLRLLGALVALILIAAACGSDTTETETGAAAETDSAMDDSMSEEHDDHGDHDGHDDDHDHANVINVADGADGADVPGVEIDLTATDTDGLYDLSITLTNFTITPENVDGDPVDNEGHMHVLVNGEKISRLMDTETTLQIPDGEHLVEVELNANNHRAYAIDDEPIRAGQTVAGSGEMLALGGTMIELEGEDHSHDHDHSDAKPAIEGDLTVDDADVTVTATIAGGEVSGVENRTTIPLGSVVALTVVSDTDDEVHVHGYDILADVTATEAGLIIFTADTPGRFEVELETDGTFITELEIS